MVTVKVRFVRTYTVKAVDGPTYQEGSVHDLRPDAARHFIVRGAAVELAETPKPKAAASAPSVQELAAPDTEENKPRRGRPRKSGFFADESVD